jgi:DNA-binding Lrp family transcriptional regulator
MNWNKDIPVCVFFTSEFSKLDTNYFSIGVPPNTQLDDNYIKLYLEHFQNISFTSPSVWSSLGMNKYLSQQKIENNNVISSYHAKLNPQEIGLGVSTFITVTLVGHKAEFIDRFVKRINEIPEVVECHHITGQGDFMLKVVAADISSYQKLILEVISEIPEIDDIQSIIILSTFKDSKVMPIPAAPKAIVG